MPDNATTRDELVNRKLPHMLLSDGTASSLTGPPPALPNDISSGARAAQRFAVKGNAIGALFSLLVDCLRYI
jgi:sorbose reductase